MRFIALALASIVSAIHATNEVTQAAEGTVRQLAEEEDKTLTTRKLITIDPTRKRFYWCMSYPGGGADDMMKLIEYVTQESHATMYASEIYDKRFDMKIDVFKPERLHSSQYTKGPWLNNGDLPAPTSKSVLVKTYCGGFCTNGNRKTGPVGGLACRRKDDYMKGLASFAEFTDECTKGKRIAGTNLITFYNKTRRKGVVVVTRDPIDLVAERFKMHARDRDGVAYNNEGLYEYCEWMDRFYHDVPEMEKIRNVYEIKEAFFKEGMKAPPCYTEIYRILRWYTWAGTLDERDEESTLIRYEDIIGQRQRGEVVEEIVNMLNLTRVMDRFDMPYDDPEILRAYFTDEDVSLMKEFMGMACPTYGQATMEPYF